VVLLIVLESEDCRIYVYADRIRVCGAAAAHCEF
jgi:hypothetical protein